ncbi:MAG: sensor histidine kinase, partial [Pseudobdellovibrionaceae bacterium]
MRNRFFFIILTTLILAAVGINLIHIKFFQSQRLKLIDKQITESSKELLESEELKKAFSTPSKIDDVISKVLKGSRIGKAFILRDPNGKIIYESFNFRLLNAELPIQPEWVTVETDTEFVRVRNLTMPGPKPLVMQVSLVLDRNFINWEIVDSRVILYVTGVVLTLFIASVLLTLILLSPLRLLIEHLKGATSKLVNLLDVEPLPKRLAKYTRGFWAQSDEFSALLSTVQKLIDRINLNYKLTRSWTLQMAHELKTPLAIMRAETESNAKAELIPRSYSGSVIKEIQQMSDIISQFLEWAELENSQVQKDLHALRMKSFVKTVVSRLDKISPGRIQTELKNDFPVFANPIHLDQLISNLITNALKFSPSSQPVHLIVSEHSMFVKDHGPGVPKEVLERLGEPFNIGASDEGRSGNGLGLAWVVTVAKLYQWS